MALQAERLSDVSGATAPSFDAVIFDMDGVVTRTAVLHAAAWKELFDDLLRARLARGEAPFPPFDPKSDYLAYVDGKPRHEGIRSFLAARGVQLVEGNPNDGPEALTVHGLVAHKEALFMQRMRREGVGVFASTIALVRRLRERGVKTAVVTSSRNGREVLRVAGLEALFDVRVDGVDAAVLGLKAKPHPDAFLSAAGLLRVLPGRAVIVEDATSGVEAGRGGGFALVIGVDRGGNRDALLAHGADLVVDDLERLDVAALDRLVRHRREEVLAWTVEQEGFDAAREHGMESIFSLGNGYLGVRGALPTPLPGSRADLFIAGVYDAKIPGRFEAEMELITDRPDYVYGELVSAPSPFRAGVALDGVPLNLVGARCRTLSRTLDLRGGILQGHVDYETDVDRRVVLRTRRCTSLADVHLLLQDMTVCFVNFSGTIELDTTVNDPDLAGNHPHLVPLPVHGVHPSLHVSRYRTRASGVEVCIVSRTLFEGEPQAAVRFQRPATIGRILTFRRFVAVFTSYDTDDPLGAAIRHIASRSWEDFDEALAAHVRRWSDVWQRADVRIPGSPATEQALRFNAYHLTSAVDHEPRVSLGARALTGRAYEGHVFWDVEMFALPFYIHTLPDVARSLLSYRHRTLDGARRRARELGYRGACYAWESTVTGDDVTPHAVRLRTTDQQIPIHTGSQQIHVTADVAFALWRYWEATQDRELMRTSAVEILVETARFWASRVTRGPRHFHLREVMGPDEYHHAVNDNAYTNWLARSNLERAVEAVAWLAREEPESFGPLAERLSITREERSEWAAVARELFCPGPNADGVIEQFEGFFDLEDIVSREERAKTPLNRLFDWEHINRTKLIKQADVLMLLHVMPEAFSRQVVAANYRYYEPLTDHASSLSPGIHAAIAARLGLREDAERYFRESLWLDLSGRGNSALGVHPACMGATWQALVFGFLGVRFVEAGPVHDPEAIPCLPSKWEGAALSLLWRGRPYEIKVAREELP